MAQPGVCNVYLPATLDQVQSNRAQFIAGGLGADWPAAGRATGDTLGFIGVYVRSDYQPILNQLLFDWEFQVNAQGLQALETSGEL